MEENTKQSGSDVVASPSATISQENEPQLPSLSNNNGLAKINLLDESQVAKAELFLKRLMRSEKGGIKSIEDGLAVIMRAQDLNLPFSTALEHVHVINGKTGVDIHVIKALLLKAGVTWDTLRDYAPLYEYTDGFNVYIDGSFPEYAVRCKNAAEALEKSNKDENGEFIYLYPVRFYQDFSGNVYKDYQLNGNFVVVNNKQQVAKVTAEKKIPIYRIPNRPVDYITEFEFRRIINNHVQTSIGKFSYSEAKIAGMLEKDTYIKYGRILISHRAFSYGARDIASDIILGAYETTEIKIMNDMEVDDQDCVVVTPTN